MAKIIDFRSRAVFTVLPSTATPPPVPPEAKLTGLGKQALLDLMVRWSEKRYAATTASGDLKQPDPNLLREGLAIFEALDRHPYETREFHNMVQMNLKHLRNALQMKEVGNP